MRLGPCRIKCGWRDKREEEGRGNGRREREEEEVGRAVDDVKRDVREIMAVQVWRAVLRCYFNAISRHNGMTVLVWWVR